MHTNAYERKRCSFFGIKALESRVDYETAKSIMHRHRHNVQNGRGIVARLDPKRRKIAFRTFLEKLDSDNDETPESYVIRYFDNPILHFHHSHFLVNDCGYFSYSTHQRLNEFMPMGFRVSGATYRWSKRTVGFVHTPVGVYAYDMSMQFSYQGRCVNLLTFTRDLSDSVYSQKAGEAFHKIPKYVDMLLNRAFAGDSAVYLARQGTTHTVSVVGLADSILRDAYLPYILEQCVTPKNLDDSHSIEQFDYPLLGVVRLILAYGAQVLRPPGTRDDLSRRTEATLLHEMEIPVVNLQKLRVHLRRRLIDELLNLLGFKAQEWNRR